MSHKKKQLLFVLSLVIFIGLVWTYYSLISSHHLINKFCLTLPPVIVLIVSRYFYRKNRRNLLHPPAVVWSLPPSEAFTYLTNVFESSTIETNDGLANWKIMAAVPESGTIKAEISFFDKTIKRTMICQAEVTPDANGNSSVVSLHYQASSSADDEILKSIITQTDLCLEKIAPRQG